jgi:hypothetical protein
MTSKFQTGLIVFLVLNLMVVNVLLYLVWNRKTPEATLISDNSCSTSCTDLINQSVKNIPVPICSCAVPTATIIKAEKTAINKIKTTQYIPIPGNGSTLENKWTDLPGTEFYISTDDYPNLNGAYFEANMRLLNGNGLAYLRLFDVTAGIEVWGSEISTGSQNFTSVSSGKMTFRTGNHLYRVQAKSLTADTTVFNSGRIKFILEN